MDNALLAGLAAHASAAHFDLRQEVLAAFGLLWTLAVASRLRRVPSDGQDQ